MQGCISSLCQPLRKIDFSIRANSVFTFQSEDGLKLGARNADILDCVTYVAIRM